MDPRREFDGPMECPHCGGSDTELQVSSVQRAIYLCNGCSKTFNVPKIGPRAGIPQRT